MARPHRGHLGGQEEEEEVDCNPEDDDLNEIEDVNRIEAAGLEVRFKKEREAERGKPED
jgi:hypothetical protein